MRPIRVGSLCSGYEGIGLGLKLVFGEVSHEWFVEYDEAPSKILATRFPGVPNYGDLKALDYALMEPVDLLTAGYPCQPFSSAGLRKGADDPRHLWPDVARAIGVLRPRLCLLENVSAHLRLGFDAVLADLARLGYDATWGLVRASDAGAPHGRARLFVVATDARDGACDGEWSRSELGQRGAAEDADGTARGERWLAAPGQTEGGRPWADVGGRGGAPAADADRDGRPRLTGLPPGRGTVHGDSGRDADRRGPVVQWGAYAPAIARWEALTGRVAPRPTESGRTGERLSPRFVEWMMGLPAGWVTDVPGLPRNAQLKALGNGVVPQQVALAVRTLLPLAVAA